jgi:hypothetical protein
MKEMTTFICSLPAVLNANTPLEFEVPPLMSFESIPKILTVAPETGNESLADNTVPVISCPNM